MTLKINEWYGRFGNNIIQLINSIEYCLQNNYHKIIFPHHTFLETNYILLKDNNDNNIVSKSGEFIYQLHINKIIDLTYNKIRKHFQKYIKPIVNIEIKKKIDVIGIHFRSGDIFSNCVHPYYIKPPYCYYQSIIDNINKIKMFSEDLKNPCAYQFNIDFQLNWMKNDFRKDLEEISQCNEIILSFSTLSIFIILMTDFEEIYVPDYMYNHFKERQYDLFDIIDNTKTKLNIVSLPNYIQPKQWKNTPQQRQIMMNYKP
jgi:hypothetical protein